MHRFARVCDDQYSSRTLELNANLSIQFLTRNYFYKLKMIYHVALDIQCSSYIYRIVRLFQRFFIIIGFIYLDLSGLQFQNCISEFFYLVSNTNRISSGKQYSVLLITRKTRKRNGATRVGGGECVPSRVRSVSRRLRPAFNGR